MIDRRCDFQQGVRSNKPINIGLCQRNKLYSENGNSRNGLSVWPQKFRVESILNYMTLELAFTDHKTQNDAKSGVSILRPFGTNLTIGVFFVSRLEIMDKNRSRTESENYSVRRRVKS